MSRQSVWATKVAALVQGGQAQAALAQIKVAPTVRDVEQLRALLATAKALAKYPNVDAAIRDQIVALSSPRLHRSP
jgi:MoxR-like ATPase